MIVFIKSSSHWGQQQKMYFFIQRIKVLCFIIQYIHCFTNSADDSYLRNIFRLLLWSLSFIHMMVQLWFEAEWEWFVSPYLVIFKYIIESLTKGRNICFTATRWNKLPNSLYLIISETVTSQCCRSQHHIPKPALQKVTGCRLHLWDVLLKMFSITLLSTVNHWNKVLHQAHKPNIY